MNRRSLARREFLDRAFLTAAALAAPPPLAVLAQEPAPKRSPNDRIRVAVLGVHSQGMSHVRHLVKMPDAELVCICDADSVVGAKAVDEVEKKFQKGLNRKGFNDQGKFHL